MSPQAEPMLSECDDASVPVYDERLRRKGQLRTDMHTFYDIPFESLDDISPQGLQRIASDRDGKYTADLGREARSIIGRRAKVEPQDRDAVDTEM